MKNRVTIIIIALLLTLAAIPVHAAEAPDLWKFGGERVTAVYSFDYAARTYQYVSDAAEAKKIVLAIPNVPVQTSGKVTDKNAVGFLIFTEKGKYPIYLPSSTAGLDKKKADLVELAKSCNKKYARHIQWFVYMSPENIERIKFSAAGGGDSTYTLNPAKYPKFGTIDINTTDAATIRKISDYLKGVAVEPVNQIIDTEKELGYNPTSSMGTLSLEIWFKNGSVYGCFSSGGGIDGSLFVGSGEQKEQLQYRFDDRGMRDFMMTVPGVKINTDFS